MSKRVKEAALKSYPPKRKSEFLTKFAEMTGSIDTMPKNTLPPSKECEKGLREPLVPTDVDEASLEYAPDLPSYNIGGGYLPPQSRNDLRIAFKDGAKWQKEQMMNDAVEGEVIGEIRNQEYEPYEIYVESDFLPLNGKFKMGDKVKLIIVKED